MFPDSTLPLPPTPRNIPFKSLTAFIIIATWELCFLHVCSLSFYSHLTG